MLTTHPAKEVSVKFEDLPKWANVWVKNKVTNEIKPAFYDIDNVELLDEEGTHFTNKWYILRTSFETKLLYVSSVAFLLIVVVGFLCKL